MWSVNHANIRPSAVNRRIESVRLAVDRVDDLLPGPAPSAAAGASKVGDPFVRVRAGLLVDAGDLNVGHSLDLLPESNVS